MNITPNGEIKLTDSPVVLDFADNKNGMSINGSQQEWVFVTNNSLSTDVPSIDEQSASMNKTISTDNTYYSLDGKLLNYPQQGINIGIDREGNIRKYYMK